MNDSKTICAENIRKLRERLRLTQNEFAKLWGVDRQSVSQYERAIQVPGYERCRRLQERCGVDAYSWTKEAQQDAKNQRQIRLLEEDAIRSNRLVRLPTGNLSIETNNEKECA